ncbi:MAG: transposase family protein [Lachnospiraceae bacterium]|nr:transposase family protein [Lachnospiraceae bacterium]
MESSNKTTFLDFMGGITDPRKPYNQLHVFLDIVVIDGLATLCGADTWNEIESWGNACRDWLSTFLVLKNAIPELIKKLAIQGCTATIDAMGTQKQTAE